MYFFFKQKTAYELRISDWSSDVCSSDLIVGSKLAHSSPTLIAACHVLHRLCMPRHSPNALTSHLRVHTTNDSPDDPKIDHMSLMKIGRAPCRDRVCQYV